VIPSLAATGFEPAFAEARRIVSLVPSLTEALFRLGLGDRVVGVTDYCVEPPEALATRASVGGTKDADPEKIATLAPDLVIANHEENTRRVVDRLRGLGLRVWVTYPRTVAEGAGLLAAMARLGASDERIAAVVAPVQAAVEEAEALDRADGTPVFCPIWKDPWMTVGADTYIHDMLSLCGGRNVFADRGDRRYPIVDEAAIEAAAPAVILLPSEPYAFGEAERDGLLAGATPAARDARVHLIDGARLSWYGPRIAEAIRALVPLLASG